MIRNIFKFAVVMWALVARFALLSASAETLALPKLRLDDQARPLGYSAELVVIPEQSNFTGKISIELDFARRCDFMWLHGHKLTVAKAYLEQRGQVISAQPKSGGDEFLGFAFQPPRNVGRPR